MSIRDATRLVIDRTIELAAVPAPPLEEGERAELVESWWRVDGLDPSIDEVGNVRARLRDGSGPATLVCAHLDTVFDRSVAHGTTTRNGKLYGPGVGDDTIGVAALSVLDRLLPPGLACPSWIIATVGEEGLGNLAGARHLIEHPPTEPGALIAIEGNYLGRIATVGVGSVRWQVRLTGPGGHAWEASDQPSAVHEMARVIARLDELLSATRGGAESSVNVGMVAGGEAINARARHAEMSVDIRSADPNVLADLEQGALDMITGHLDSAIKADVEELGRRPAGRLDDGHELVRAAMRALISVGRTPQTVAASTDANAAHAADVPAIAIGITTGSGEHTPGEWIELAPIADGLAALAQTIVEYDGRAS